MSSGITLVCINGTWGRDDEWSRNPEFRRMAYSVGSYHFPSEQFCWSGKLEGLWGQDVVWDCWARALRWYCCQIPDTEQIDIIAHSHGGQIAIRAIAEKRIHVRNLITISTPVRDSMGDMRKQCAANISGEWLHMHGEILRDWWARLGRLGAGWRPQLTLEMPEADNVYCRGHGHSSMLIPEVLEVALERVQPR